MREGLLLVNKEKGKSAFFLVSLLRRLTGIKKIGHAGTLDPFATGVMVMLIGKTYTRLSDTFLNDDKEYIATAFLGRSTTTYDIEGETLNTSDIIPTLNEIEEKISGFQGTTLQIPPMFSAKKIAGKKLYELARKGIEVPREPKSVTMKIDILDYSYPTLKLKVRCSKGTYIRSLAYDLGEALGTHAHLKGLIRTASGQFALEDCVETEQIKDLSFNYTEFLKYENCLAH
ncbi:MAG: tRNA pseudouridine synthase B [Chlamydiia bacterium]|nr:tRNA pseudouridine synthase B [Chlamydiia bacterium]MCH9615165.1 tRNA pseudouridine synthase B [Chlamydiia bacterium]MCH9628513.1 tRNA pseudouridine synthase B [Chlamydiia bacterium]